VILLPSAARGQIYDPAGVDLQTASQARRVWTIFGRVTTLGGDPIRQARITVDTGVGKPDVLETNLKGEFSTEVAATATQFETLHARIVASKEGYFTARESEDFAATNINVVLRRF
jgi:hypothetical protein